MHACIFANFCSFLSTFHHFCQIFTNFHQFLLNFDKLRVNSSILVVNKCMTKSLCLTVIFQSKIVKMCNKLPKTCTFLSIFRSLQAFFQSKFRKIGAIYMPFRAQVIPRLLGTPIFSDFSAWFSSQKWSVAKLPKNGILTGLLGPTPVHKLSTKSSSKTTP